MIFVKYLERVIRQILWSQFKELGIIRTPVRPLFLDNIK
jgi:hypothetical protein